MEKRNNADHSKFYLFWNDKEIRWDEKSILNKQEIAKALFTYFFDTKNGLSAEDRQHFFDFYKQKKIIQEEFTKNCFDKFSFIHGGKKYFLLYTKWSGNKPGEQFDLLIRVASQYGFRIEKASYPSESHSKTVKSLKETVSACPTEECTPTSEKISIQEIKDARDKMVFCDENIVKTLKTSYIVDLLVGENGIFPDAMKNVLKERYLQMRCNFKKQWEKDDCWTQKMPEGTFNIVHGSSDALLEVPASICQSTLTEKIFTNDVTNIGHDLPIWLYYGKKNAQSRRVMIISQDPKRAGHSGNDLLLSTPWAHHSLEFLLRKPRFPQLMAMRLVHSYLKRGDIVYLTDYKKLYWTGESTGIYLDSTYQKILKKEIEYFNPDFIVSLGDQAAEALTGGWHDEKKKIDHRNKKCSLLPGLCPDRNNIPNVYVKYHTNARSNHNPHYNDPEYWYVAPSEEQGSSGDQNGFIASNDISKQGDKQ